MYRIEEFNRKYDIQKLATVTKGMLWWKKTKEEWCYVTEMGIALPNGSINLGFGFWLTKMNSLPTLAHAKEKIEEFKRGIVYHEVL